MLSIAMVYFRDTQHFMAIFIQLWFYATPIIYSEVLVLRMQEQGAGEPAGPCSASRSRCSSSTT